jgi:hypothetical protein
MAELKGFYKLPRELRDQIYICYFSLEGGYTLNPLTNRLRTSDGSNIDLGLRLVSLRIAHETRGVALKSNAVDISTYYSDELRVRAGYFNTLLDIISNQKAESLLIHAPFSGCIDITVFAFIRKRHPLFVPILELLQT